MAKSIQTRAELEAHFRDHIDFLESSADAYDRGKDGEAKRLAVSLRVLLHDTDASHSLLGQLDRRTGSFISTALPYEEANTMPHGGLVMVAADGPKSKYVAMLDQVPFQRWLPFEDWWNEAVFVDKERRSLSRKQLVLAVANQDGGAHVDPKLSETYARLSRHNAMGWRIGDPIKGAPIPLAERAAIRQIAHECLKTLQPGYAKAPSETPMMFFGGGGAYNSPDVPDLPRVASPGRNDPCPCGSGKKFKKCHGAPAI